MTGRRAVAAEQRRPMGERSAPAVHDRLVEIDVDALAGNAAVLMRRLSPCELIGVVKADGYGHGSAIVARALKDAGVPRLGVADVQEAIALRREGIAGPVLAWLHGPNADLAGAVDCGIELGVSSRRQLDQAAAIGGATVHLKVDTGLSRNGIPAEELPLLLADAVAHQRAGRLEVRALFTHLSNASDTANAHQLAAFDNAVARARAAGLHDVRTHIGGSHSALTVAAGRYDAARVGIALYGLDPGGLAASLLALRPAMRFSARVAATRRVAAGTGVSYDYTHVTTRETTLALLPVGYADGVPRAVSGRGAKVALAGGLHPIVGRVAMDQCVVDVGDAEVRVGEEAVLWGDPARDEPSLEDWAASAGTITYELLTSLGRRVDRIVTSHRRPRHGAGRKENP